MNPSGFLHVIRRRAARCAPRLRACMVAALVVAPMARAAAVSVTPTALYIDQRTRSGTLLLWNSGTLPEEIEIGFAFGYPRSDSLGNISVQLVDVAPTGEPTLVPWLRAFPRRLRLEPGQRQTVRVMVQPPPGVAAGEYWGRITITSRGGQPPIEQQEGEVRVSVSVQTVIVAAVTYRQGEVTTGLAVKAASAGVGADTTARLTMDLSRTGNAAYLGRVRADLVAPDGSVVGSTTEDLAVYRDLRRVIVVEIPARYRASPATLTLRFTITAERPDLPPNGPLPAAPLTGSVRLR